VHNRYSGRSVVRYVPNRISVNRPRFLPYT